ncbi:DNA polymerase beta superfamily protein [Clostridium sp. JS66]|uniref:nucleotidyltransferase domain-containing protein n=1 Tax=Clostridium sp. JS66 TaxID=3064705 RepID=UPI00298E7E72|nr:nucleotidyltransferase domain-containing protein [Clostridium sp. JS66]WPC40160.1 nucleotidyltransferase domain-containing protein [Clostridium sp. JS66]
MILKQLLTSNEYDFIKTDEHLGKYVVLLGLSGSYSYGTNNSDSDIDVRGVTLNRKSDLIGMTSFEQYIDDNTDTCIYGFNKIISLLLNCNPNTIELLGLKPEHYLYLNNIGQELLDNRKMFLSKKAIQSFGGYASAQLRRLQNALARDSYPQVEKERHIYNSIRNAMYDFSSRYESFEDGSLKVYIDKSKKLGLDSEIFIDANLRHYPLRDYKGIWAEMNNIVKEYDKLGKRNKKKDDNHLNKHAMHLIRLFMMAIDILEKQEINTYRKNEQEMLMSIRKGDYQKEDGTYREEFYELLSDFENKLQYAAKHTCLPDEPNMKKVQEFVISVNERVVRDEI